MEGHRLLHESHPNPWESKPRVSWVLSSSPRTCCSERTSAFASSLCSCVSSRVSIERNSTVIHFPAVSFSI
ncbi:rCG63210 [Rattus norvegicus]|uniref:RCG63210 n=1 Tax=Rattus norvegicus TaxID=10116 RepID=A6JSU4_RAT|nr:rCG63210 [Rattus norvegicus]